MAKKGNRNSPKARQQSKKWSKSNTANFALNALVVISMVLGSVLVFGGAATTKTQPVPNTPIAITATPAVTPDAPTLTPTAAPR